ncbi:MAG: ribonuclease, partial [Acidobacteriaceae bacterium]
MAKEICISSTPHETRLAILEDDQLAEIYYERENEYTLAGSIYKGRVTRVLPGMQSAFVDVGLERDAFLYVTDFLEEQEEDSAEFERTESSGNGRRPREAREPREPVSAAREPSSDFSAAEAPPRRNERSQERGERGDESGTRRWHGRRGRRFGGRQSRPEGRPDQSSLESPEVVEEAISAEPVARPERGAPGGMPAQKLPIV